MIDIDRFKKDFRIDGSSCFNCSSIFFNGRTKKTVFYWHYIWIHIFLKDQRRKIKLIESQFLAYQVSLFNDDNKTIIATFLGKPQKSYCFLVARPLKLG